jgi:hypothetical protein
MKGEHNMPLYRTNNQQGAASNQLSPEISTDAAAPTLLLEWGHFIEKTPNLLLVNGSVEVQLGISEIRSIEFELTMDGATITVRREFLQSSDFFASVSFGARLQDVPVGHHVFRLFAVASGTRLFTGGRDASSFSGSPD